MKIIIIGSKGFIGQHLKKYFINRHHAVWGADVIIDYAHPEQYFLIDASNADYHDIFQSQTFDCCINCSGAASVPDSLEHPNRDFNLNAANVFKLLDAIRQFQPTCKFLNLSSAAVYGNPGVLPIAENSNAKPVSPYGFHKKMSEQICEEFHRFFGISTCSLRIFSAYGEGLHKQLFWDLYQKAKSRQLIKLFGTGRESRDFIYIHDLTRAIYLVVQHATFNNDIINVANGQEIFIEECARTFYSLFNYKVKYEFVGKTRPGDPNNWVADISALIKLGYQHQYSLAEGLKNYYEWIQAADSALE